MAAVVAKTAIEPLSAALGATLATALAVLFALAWWQLREKSAAAQAQRLVELELRVAALTTAVTWDALSPRLDKLFGRINAARSDLESLDAVLVATGILKQPVVIRREREPS